MAGLASKVGCVFNIFVATVVLTDIMDVIRHFVKFGLHLILSHEAEH